ncbi:indolepyruvate ferredoxin oxidoreductase, alpha subunit [Candidatus Magnetomorum sp. HK-1]|nr:indolepyruvate ferredoxin oxidoreductase, alpha subunit [Candidatus Magnetomorum sp. HK-1]
MPHKLLTDKPGKKELMLGNEAITRGAIEAGLRVGATYPGTPSSEISLNLFQISQETDLYFEYSTNEKVALEVSAAAAASGVRSMCIVKHVGLNVAADPLMTLAYVGVKGGMVIVTADDPLMFSSQNEQDNRYYALLSGLPMLEPSSIDEARAMTKYAFELSEQLHEPVLLRTTTRINHSTGPVVLDKILPIHKEGQFTKDPFRLVTIPAVSRNLHVQLLENIKKAAILSESSAWNINTGDGKWGIICNGVSYNYVSDAVSDLKISDKVRILRIGFSHPLPNSMIKSFLKACERVLIVEEGEPWLETQIKAIAQENELILPINGKDETLFSRLYEYDPTMVRSVIAKYFDISDLKNPVPDLSDLPEIPGRPPNLCAGCGHRAAFFAVKQAAKTLDVEVIYPTDIGCYTLGVLPPLSMADYLICMGSSVGTSCGFSKVLNKKIVAFIGDSTFFHSGIPGLVNAVFNQHQFTLVILDNGTTAMTGHQPHPGVDMTQWNLDGFTQISIEKVVRAIGVQHVSVIRPYQVKKSISVFKEAFEFKGVSVVIAQEPCALINKKRKKRAFQVTDRCKNHRVCINEFACPAFYLENNQLKINPSQCVGCAVCAQICPENAIIPVKEAS